MKKSLILISILILFSGCVVKNSISKSQSALILLKSSSFKFYDSGFINLGDFTNLQIFSTGNLILNLNFHKNSICIDGNCFKKEVFNSNFLNSKYPKNLFERVILGEKIFNQEGLREIDGGFEQKIEGSFDIKYRVIKGREIYFKDRFSKILIKIRFQN